LAINCETGAGGAVVGYITGYCRSMQENHRNAYEENDTVVTSKPYTPLRKSRD